MAEQKKIPITRISRFFGSQDFNLEQDMGMEWLDRWGTCAGAEVGARQGIKWWGGGGGKQLRWR